MASCDSLLSALVFLNSDPGDKYLSILMEPFASDNHYENIPLEFYKYTNQLINV